LYRPRVSGALLTEMILTFEKCKWKDVVRYVKIEFPQWEILFLTDIRSNEILEKTFNPEDLRNEL
jgi:hypothetical protein